MKLTGRKRYRSARTWFRQEYLVLQVEVEGLITENIGGRVECERRTWWRDATTEDLTEGQIAESNKLSVHVSTI